MEFPINDTKFYIDYYTGLDSTLSFVLILFLQIEVKINVALHVLYRLWIVNCIEVPCANKKQITQTWFATAVHKNGWCDENSHNNFQLYKLFIALS